MKLLVDSVYCAKTFKAIEASGFPVGEIVTLYPEQDARTRSVPCPSHPGNARTSIYVIQLQQADALVVTWDGKDMELINLAIDMGLPIFVLYQNEHFEYGFRLNWEDDF